MSVETHISPMQRPVWLYYTGATPSRRYPIHPWVSPLTYTHTQPCAAALQVQQAAAWPAEGPGLTAVYVSLLRFLLAHWVSGWEFWGGGVSGGGQGLLG